MSEAIQSSTVTLEATQKALEGKEKECEDMRHRTVRKLSLLNDLLLFIILPKTRIEKELATMMGKLDRLGETVGINIVWSRRHTNMHYH